MVDIPSQHIHPTSIAFSYKGEFISPTSEQLGKLAYYPTRPRAILPSFDAAGNVNAVVEVIFLFDPPAQTPRPWYKQLLEYLS